jgi:hypothetical protein
MQHLAVFGAQWGDEGKEKIVDLLCEALTSSPAITAAIPRLRPEDPVVTGTPMML